MHGVHLIKHPLRFLRRISALLPPTRQAALHGTATSYSLGEPLVCPTDFGPSPFLSPMSDSPAPSKNSSTLSQSPLRPGSVGIPLLFLLVVLFFMQSIPAWLHWPARLITVAAVGWLAYLAYRFLRTVKLEKKKVVFSLILMAIVYGTFHVMCLVFVTLMSDRDEVLADVEPSRLSRQARLGIRAMLDGQSPVIYDREIGWTHRPGHQWNGHTVTEQGFRGTRLYPETPADPGKRILCMGDSFTFGYEEADNETFPYHGEQLRPGTEWINMGICGAGLTQALLQYRKTGRKFGGKHVVIAFMTDNQKRTVNCFRALIAAMSPMTPLTKPYAKMTQGRLSIEPNPYQDISDYETLLANEPAELARLEALDYPSWSNQHGSHNPVVRTLAYVMERRNVDRNFAILLGHDEKEVVAKVRKMENPYGRAIWEPESPGFQANAAVVDLFYEEVIKDGRVPLIVSLPDLEDVEKRADGGKPMHHALLAHLKDKGYRHFDFLDSLERRHPENLTKEAFFVATHYNGETNKFLAEEIIKALELR